MNGTVPNLVICLLLLSASTSNMAATPGVRLAPLPGYYSYNLYPTLNSTENGPVYDPNFIPGFQVGLTNTSIHWDSGLGYAHIGYSIGPWKSLQVGLPHLAVGPQCCNFQEIPRTQQFRAEDWGDFYYVKAGFLPRGVNVPNFTTNFSSPAYVGLRTDWDWVVSVSLDWATPRILNPDNRWAAIGIAATQYVPNAPKKLVYTVVNFWMDENSSTVLARGNDPSKEYVAANSHVVIYHPIQLSEVGNQTITLTLSPLLRQTLQILNFTSSNSGPPVISYIYLNIEGYNMEWKTTLYSFLVMSDHNPSSQGRPEVSGFYYVVPIIIAAAAGVAIVYSRIRKHA